MNARCGLAAAILLLTAAAGAEEPPRYRADLNVGADSFSRNYTYSGFAHLREGVEGSAGLVLSARVRPGLALLAGGELQSPLQHVEGRALLGAYWAALPTLVLNGSVAYAPERRVIARWDLQAGAELQVLPWLALLASVRHLDFPSDDLSGIESGHDAVTAGSGALRLGPVRRFSLQLGGGLSHHTGTFLKSGAPTGLADTGFFASKLFYELSEDLSFAAGFSTGAESRRPFLPELTSTITALTLGARYAFDERWAARLEFVHESFEEEYLRNGASLGLTTRF